MLPDVEKEAQTPSAFAQSSNGKDSRLPDLAAMLDAHDRAKASVARNAIVAAITNLITADPLFYARAAAENLREKITELENDCIKSASERDDYIDKYRTLNKKVAALEGELARKIEHVSELLKSAATSVAGPGWCVTPDCPHNTPPSGIPRHSGLHAHTSEGILDGVWREPGP